MPASQKRRIPLANVIKAAREAGATRVEVTGDGYIIDLVETEKPRTDTGNDFDRLLERKKSPNDKAQPKPAVR